MLFHKCELGLKDAKNNVTLPAWWAQSISINNNSNSVFEQESSSIIVYKSLSLVKNPTPPAVIWIDSETAILLNKYRI